MLSWDSVATLGAIVSWVYLAEHRRHMDRQIIKCLLGCCTPYYQSNISLNDSRDPQQCIASYFMMIFNIYLLAVSTAAAFKAGKIQNNPFSQASTSGGAAIPPPSNLAGCILCVHFIT